MENPNSGGTPANDKIVMRNKKLNGNIVPNFFKSLKFLIKRVSNVFKSKKNVKIKNI